jgi:hypothetical protein
LEGVLPTRLKFIRADTEQIVSRFYRACIGWIRYKPLLLYITMPESYEENIAAMRSQLRETLPKICLYFGRPDFMKIIDELERYHNNVRRYYREFMEAQRVWAGIMEHFVRDI